MKYKYLIIIVVVIILIIISIVLLTNKKSNVVIKDSVRLRLLFTQGYMMNADTEYEYKLEEDKYIMNIKPYLVDRENIVSFEVDKKVIKEIENILNKYEVYKWDGFNKSDNNVLDGDSFAFSVYTNEVRINAAGYMKYPDNYGTVKEEIVKIFEREYEKNK